MLREYWLQKYIKEHREELGFSDLEGPFETGPDFRGVYKGQKVSVEAEMEYKGYLQHRPGFADVLIVGTLDPTPPQCKDRLPPTIITVDRQKVLEWSAPLRQVYRQKAEEGRQKVIDQLPPEIQDILTSTGRIRTEKLKELGCELVFMPWKRLAQALARLYAYYVKVKDMGNSVIRPYLAFLKHEQEGFSGYDEDGFWGDPEDEAAREYWLNIAFAVAPQFELRPTLDSLTWIDGLDRKLRDIGNLDPAELKQLEPIVTFVELFT